MQGPLSAAGHLTQQRRRAAEKLRGHRVAQALPEVCSEQISIEAALGHHWDAAPSEECAQEGSGCVRPSLVLLLSCSLSSLVALWPRKGSCHPSLPALQALHLELLALQHCRGGESLLICFYSSSFSLALQFFLFKGDFSLPSCWLGRAGRVLGRKSSLQQGSSSCLGAWAELPYGGEAVGMQGCCVPFLFLCSPSTGDNQTGQTQGLERAQQLCCAR